MNTLLVTNPMKKHKDFIKYDKGSFKEVQQIWVKINNYKEELKKTYEDMPVSTTLDYFNKRQNVIKHNITELEEDLQQIELMIKAEKEKYSSKDYLVNMTKEVFIDN